MNHSLQVVSFLGMTSTLFWGLVLAVAVIVELATLNLISTWFAFAALAAMIASLLGASLLLQFILFSLLSVLGFLVFAFIIRPRLGQRPITPTNADRILGKEGVVVETIHSTTGKGLVKVEGQTWSARLEGDGILREGNLIRVTGIRGVKALVEPLEGTIEPLD